jgi:hypothetical protein
VELVGVEEKPARNLSLWQRHARHGAEISSGQLSDGGGPAAGTPGGPWALALSAAFVLVSGLVSAQTPEPRFDLTGNCASFKDRVPTPDALVFKHFAPTHARSTNPVTLYKFCSFPLRQPCASTLSIPTIHFCSFKLNSLPKQPPAHSTSSRRDQHHQHYLDHHQTTTTTLNKMRSFQQVIVLLFALVAFAFAEETSYLATTTLTSTVQVILTATVTPDASSTLSTSVAAYPTSVSAAPVYSVPANSTMPYPTASGAPTASTGPAPTVSDFPGAAAGLSANSAFIGAVAAALGYLAL